MNADFPYRIIKFAIKKAMNGDFQPQQYMDVINIAQKSYQNYLIGQLEQYQYGNSSPRIQYSQNEISRQKLTPLIYGYNLLVDVTGFSPYPGDYCLTDSMLSIYGQSRIRYCKQEQLFSTVNSGIDSIATNPIYLIENKGFRFYPITQGSALLSYVRNVPDIVWGYTTDANGRSVYNQASSTDPIWADNDMLEIIVRALALVGVNLQLNVVNQYAEQIKKGGE